MASKPDSTGGSTPSKKGKAVRANTGVGGVRSSDDPVPDLSSGELAKERKDATCSAEVPRSKGRGDGPKGPRRRKGIEAVGGRASKTAPKKVRKLQITLYRKAKSNPGYRFWSLNGEVQRADVLEEAWRRVKANAGAAGIDGVEIADLVSDPTAQGTWLSALQKELHQKTYRPMPLRRKNIRKPNGGIRKLGIPTVKDRVAQMAAYLVLMPIFEADFHPNSFGFRPNRSAHQAVKEIRQALMDGRTDVVDADLTQCFDTIPHRKLMRQVARRVSDGAILKLIRACCARRSWRKTKATERS